MRTARRHRSVSGRLGVVVRNVVPLRAESKPSSEQVTQALIGQPVVAEGGQRDWLFVQTWDTYRGWIHESAVRFVDDPSRPYASAGAVAIVRELFADVLEAASERARIITKATISAEIEVARADGDWVELRLPDERAGFMRRHEARLVDRDLAQTIWLPEPAKLVETALRLIGVPYLWGGTSPFGIDCSGFVQLVYRVHGVTLLRDAGIQAGDPRGERVGRSELRAGDLVFFTRKGDSRIDPDTSGVTHVGMMIDGAEFVHSAGSTGVTVTALEDPDYSDRLWGARRMRIETLDPGGGAPQD